MPGFDHTGPAGAGPMTGGARGFCNPAYSVYGSRFYGDSEYMRGRGARRCFRGGFGIGRNRRRNFSPGLELRRYASSPVFASTKAEEIDLLQSEADYLRSSLERIEKRIAELETDSSAQVQNDSR